MGAAGTVWKRNRWCGHHYDRRGCEAYRLLVALTRVVGWRRGGEGGWGIVGGLDSHGGGVLGMMGIRRGGIGMGMMLGQAATSGHSGLPVDDCGCASIFGQVGTVLERFSLAVSHRSHRFRSQPPSLVPANAARIIQIPPPSRPPPTTALPPSVPMSLPSPKRPFPRPDHPPFREPPYKRPKTHHAPHSLSSPQPCGRKSTAAPIPFLPPCDHSPRPLTTRASNSMEVPEPQVSLPSPAPVQHNLHASKPSLRRSCALAPCLASCIIPAVLCPPTAFVPWCP